MHAHDLSTSAATENLYKIENSGKYYVSLDFTSANFNALRYYDPRLVFETKVRHHALSDSMFFICSMLMLTQHTTHNATQRISFLYYRTGWNS
jgi:hypothetical protein